MPTRRGDELLDGYLPKQVLTAEISPTRKLAHFILILRNVKGALERSADVASRNGVNILSGFHHAPSTSEKALWSFFADLTEATISPERFLTELKSLPTTIDARFQLASGGLLVDRFHFPVEWAGERAVLFRAETLGTIFARVNEIFGGGPAAGVLLYEMGEAAGRSTYQFVKDMVGEEAIKQELEQWVNLFRATGWGIVRLERVDCETNQASLEVRANFECVHYKGKSSDARGHFLRGFIVGWFSEVFGKRMTAQESSCVAKGDESCRFTVSQR